MPPTQHTVEYKALKFGDQTNSHVLVPLQSKTFKKNFEVSFEFRTYYPNGLFFIASVSLCMFFGSFMNMLVFSIKHHSFMIFLKIICFGKIVSFLE